MDDMFEQRMAHYRSRIREKLKERGCSDDTLEEKTEALMQRKLPINLPKMIDDKMIDEEYRLPTLIRAFHSEIPTIKQAVDNLLMLQLLSEEETPEKIFYIGCEFTCGDKLWRCTDIGSRLIAAICLSEYPDDQSWFNGPPYAVVEHYFDEDSQISCEIISKQA